MDISVKNVMALCRVCLKTAKSFYNIFTKGIFSKGTIADKIMECAPIQITQSDGLPLIICFPCVHKLQITHRFRSSCVQNDALLHQYIAQINDNSELKNNLSNEINQCPIREEDEEEEEEIGDCDSDDELKFYVSDNDETCGSVNEQASVLEQKINDIISKNNDILSSASIVKKTGYKKSEHKKSKINSEKKIVSNKNFILPKTTVQEKQNGDLDATLVTTENELSYSLENTNENNFKHEDETQIEKLPKNIKETRISSARNTTENNKSKIKSDRKNKKSIRCIKVISKNKVIYRCKFCNKTYPHLFYLEDHCRTHTGERPFQCDVCQRLFTSKILLNKHRRVQHSGNYPYMCDVCGKRFKHSTSWKRHWRVHSGEKPYKCSVCQKSFASSFNLQVHKRTHTDERPFQCDMCSKTFKQRSSMQTHQRSHSGERPWLCNVCGKGFILEQSLRLHRRVHTGERPYKCELCAKTFTQRSSLRIHEKTHSDKSDERNISNKKSPPDLRFKCGVCGKGFTYNGSLRYHEMGHTGEKPCQCSICGKSFAYTALLTRHLKIHSGEKPYTCEICNKSFSRKDNLQDHVGIHTGSRPFKCQVCGKCFAARSYLSGHKRIHTTEKKLNTKIVMRNLNNKTLM